jgi:HipA-like protein
VLETVLATRYVTPLREGGSLPGLVEADDLGTYVMKFRGAGQGMKALVAEVISGELARRLGLRVPALRAIRLDRAIARFEADQEVQDLLNASIGLNLGVDFLPGAFGYDGDVPAGGGVGASVLWLDAFTANVDRSWRNPNLLLWHGDLWVIDHGASLYFHHNWGEPRVQARAAFKPIKNHVLLPYASDLRAADEALAPLLTPEAMAGVLSQIPDGWLIPHERFADAGAQRAAYLEYLTARLEAPRLFVEEAEHARAQSLL